MIGIARSASDGIGAHRPCGRGRRGTGQVQGRHDLHGDRRHGPERRRRRRDRGVDHQARRRDPQLPADAGRHPQGAGRRPDPLERPQPRTVVREVLPAISSDVPSVVVSDGVEPMGIAEGPYTGKPNPACLDVAGHRADLCRQHPRRLRRARSGQRRDLQGQCRGLQGEDHGDDRADPGRARSRSPRSGAGW